MRRKYAEDRQKAMHARVGFLKKAQKKLKAQISRKRCVLEQNGRADDPPPGYFTRTHPSDWSKVTKSSKLDESSRILIKARELKIVNYGKR